MTASEDDIYCADQARRYDPDRALAVLFAPEEKRGALMALLAFNIEIAKTRETVSEPMLGEIRLQWWREAVAEIYGGAPRRHAVVQPLADAVGRCGLPRAPFDRLIDARAGDLDESPPADLAALIDYADATSATLAGLALEVLGVEGGEAAEAGRNVGIAWAPVGLLRAVPFHARARRQYLPADLMAAAGAKESDLFAMRPTPPLADVVTRVADTARERLAAARAGRQEAPRAALPALLPATLADFYLRRMAAADHNVLGRPIEIGRAGRTLRYSWAALRGRY
ncbi:MAG: phytoene/squalene synthase family protein [Alphaproteobacteria bacterium]